MKNPLFTGRTTQEPKAPLQLPPTHRGHQVAAAGYRADEGLVDAVNVALLLGQPLLLTGEPGTGKTQLASRIAWELGYGKPLVFETKSTSTAKDLFYTYDSLRRFHSAHIPGASQDHRDYLTYNALGRAILLSNNRSDVQELLPVDFEHPGKRQSVVLIDEVDKAPRDFPNDLLNEVDQMFFRIPEFNNVRVDSDPNLRPVLLISSNSEKNLPDPFLRRCVFYHIPFPDKLRLADIVLQRIAPERVRSELTGSQLLASALDFFLKLREQNLNKRPSTAELINWIDVLTRTGADPNKHLRESREQLEESLSTLVKTENDVGVGRQFVAQFLKSGS